MSEHLVNDSLHQVKLSLQRGVQQQGEGVELDTLAGARPLRVGLPQVTALLL